MTNAPTRKQLCDAVWDRPGVMWPMHVAGWLDAERFTELHGNAPPASSLANPQLWPQRGKCANPRKPRARYAKRKRNK